MLARDLNLLLDRIPTIIGRLDTAPGKVVAATDDVIALQAELPGSLDSVVPDMRRLGQAP
ncbi:hypothetical protein FIU89_16735 [Roseovarius sp. THAF27]|uniref:hypothetical protein n=1 Tax=Roseovarius sp. THAF27 TaxID=2587850 RepID=UPI0012683A36|nr:hypothetical protein [Roseovarius sp. THAF27]QFT82274.1 hypothetical protein FIU89_16735 [Roseovarius sp. THAF27]